MIFSSEIPAWLSIISRNYYISLWPWFENDSQKPGACQFLCNLPSLGAVHDLIGMEQCIFDEMFSNLSLNKAFLCVVRIDELHPPTTQEIYLKVFDTQA